MCTARYIKSPRALSSRFSWRLIVRQSNRWFSLGGEQGGHNGIAGPVEPHTNYGKILSADLCLILIGG